MNHCSSCEIFPIVYFQGKMIDLLNYFHFYFQLSFKKAKLDFPSESLSDTELVLISREFKLEDEK